MKLKDKEIQILEQALAEVVEEYGDQPVGADILCRIRWVRAQIRAFSLMNTNNEQTRIISDEIFSQIDEL
jgi:hypothetical protein